MLGKCWPTWVDFGATLEQNPLMWWKAIVIWRSECIKHVEVAPPAGGCLVYSEGINGEWSFDEAMASYVCQVYAFDPPMTFGDHDHTPAIHFYNLGFNSRDYTNGNGWCFRTLWSTYELLKGGHGDQIIDYFKLDIEFDEWIVTPNINISTCPLPTLNTAEFDLSPTGSIKNGIPKVYRYRLWWWGWGMGNKSANFEHGGPKSFYS